MLQLGPTCVTIPSHTARGKVFISTSFDLVTMGGMKESAPTSSEATTFLYHGAPYGVPILWAAGVALRRVLTAREGRVDDVA
jgi:hypothetical protein